MTTNIVETESTRAVVTENTLTDVVEIISRGPAGPGGARGNYGSFYDLTVQALIAANVEQRVRIATTLEHLNVDLIDNKIIFRDAGTYSFTFSIQFTNTENNAVHGARVWLKYQGAVYPDSASYLAIPGARTGVPGEAVCTVNFVGTATGEDDYVELFWTADSTNVAITTIDATGTVPNAPGVILTVTQVMYGQLGPTGPIGPTGPEGDVTPEVIAAKEAAEQSALEAQSGATVAATQAAIATTKAEESAISATAAATSATAAATSATAAQTSAGLAGSNANAAALSADNAAASAVDALESENAAGDSATTATAQAGIATTQAAIATTQAASALADAGAASNSADSAAASQISAASSATAAAGSASTASAQATNAAASATAAASNASAASTSATNAASNATAAETSATNAANSAASATASASSAASSAADARAAADVAVEANAVISLFPDPYFDVIGAAPTTKFNGYAAVSGLAGYTNRSWDSSFNHIYGEGAWLYDSASTARMAFDLWHAFETADLVSGDQFSVAVMVVGASGSVGLRARQFDSQSTSYVWGSNAQQGSGYTTMDGALKVIKLENLTVSATAAGTAIYLLDNVASNFRVLAVWAVKGQTIGNRPPPRQAKELRDTVITNVIGAAYAPEFAKANWAVSYVPQWEAETLIGSDITGLSQTARTNNFSGYGDVVTPPESAINALQVSVQQATGGAETGADSVIPWVRIGCFVRTGASGTAHTSSGTLLATGYVDVDPAVTSYSDLVIPLRDPITGNLLTAGIAPASYGAEVFHCVYAIKADGTLASLNQPNGTRTDRVAIPRSYYTLYSRDAITWSWSVLSGNPSIGIRHLWLASLQMAYAASSAMQAAVGGESGLSGRVAVALTDYGVPRGLAWRPELLVDWRRFRAMRLAGSAEQFDIAVIGDSWTDRDQRYVRQMTKDLVTELGDAGPGWIGFGFSSAITGNARSDIYTVAKSGTWTSDYGTAPTPNISNALSSEAAAKYTVTATASATAVLASMRLYWTGTVDGVVRYRWNGGTWTSLNVQGSGFQSALLSGIPATAAWTLEIEVVSGSVNLQGLDGRSAAAGVRVHKLSNSGSHAARWTAVDGAAFVAAVTQIAPKMTMICLGTNDRAQSYTPSSFHDAMNTLIGRVRAAAPVCDLMLLAPCENERADAYPMVEYTNQQGKLADAHGCSLIDLQYAFGLDVAVYKLGGTRPWFGDTVHPVDSTVANIIPAALKRLFAT